MYLCNPNFSVNPDTSVTTKTANTSQPQPLVAIPNPSAVTAAPTIRTRQGATRGTRWEPRVGHTHEQHPEQGAEQVLLLPDRHQDDRAAPERRR